MSRFHDTFLFYFKPTKMKIVTKQLSDKYDENTGIVSQSKHQKRLDRLMRKIRLLENTDEAIDTFSSEIKEKETRTLLSVFPDMKESEETLNKCALLLSKVESDLVPTRLWRTYQRMYLNDFVLYTLTNRPEIINELGIINNSLRLELQKAFDSTVIHEAIYSVIEGMNGAVSERLNVINIDEKSTLGIYLVEEMLIKNIPDDQYVQIETLEGIIKQFNKMDLNKKKRAIMNYIESKEFQYFNRSILDMAFKDFGSIKNHNHRWDFLNYNQLEKLNNWLMLSNIEEVFASDKDNERFEFWKNYIQHMKEAYLIKKQPIILMRFEGFAVVEFGKKGAAYFYHEEGFEKVILPVKNSERFRHLNSAEGINGLFKRKDEFKDRRTGAQLYINSYPHHSGWQRRFNLYMSNYLNGNFEEVQSNRWR
ncbi:hypothetical protein [Salisediminibacterium beveridgei]|uniref:Zorya protein ZorC EH domain-containing protein n=1 Tax=Salisediminibacterium beveridgei TaxID=632773 RepID=A0A1D7QX36_9BACI|nr:hypothetical protein [Salisediminibacterium beveridgei]AOM83538.1 hypothetical protein BBEV_2180 [Salisediminibacterium beveridgei]